MPNSISSLHAVVVEPNRSLLRPYEYLSPTYEEHRVSMLTDAYDVLGHIVPDLILLSSSFGPMETIDFLQVIKQTFTKSIVPLLIVIDLQHRVNFIPGIYWDNKLAVVDSAVNEDVFVLTIARVTNWHPY